MVKYKVFYDSHGNANILKETTNLKEEKKISVFKRNVSNELAEEYKSGVHNSFSLVEKLAMKLDKDNFWVNDFLERYSQINSAFKVCKTFNTTPAFDMHSGLEELTYKIQVNIDDCLRKAPQEALENISKAFEELNASFEKQIEESESVLGKMNECTTMMQVKINELEKEKMMYLNAKLITAEQLSVAEEEATFLSSEVDCLLNTAYKGINEEQVSLNKSFVNVLKDNFTKIKRTPETKHTLDKLYELLTEYEYEVFDIEYDDQNWT